MTSRQTSLAGTLFAICLAVGLFLFNPPDSTASSSQLVTFYAKASNRAHFVAGLLVLAVAAIAWLVFTTGVRERLHSPSAERLAAVGSAAGAGLISVAAALVAVVPASMSLESAPIPSADILRVLPNGGYAVLTVGAMPIIAVTVAAIAIDAVRTGWLPRWLGWTGVVTAVLLLASYVFFPMLLLSLWVLAVSVTLGRRPLRIPAPVAA